jgi:predicted  nucleic acid-binding Zn-ribbon protein
VVFVKALTDLIDSDRWIDRLTSQRSHLPESAELLTTEDELRRRVGDLKDLESQRANLAEQLANSQALSDPLRTRLRSLEQSAQQATGATRDLVALEREIIHVRGEIDRCDERELELMEELEGPAHAIATLKAATAPLIARRRELLAVIDELQASIDEEIAAKRHERERQAHELPEPWRRAYEDALRRAGVSGGSYIDGQRCDGCRIALSPLDLDRWRLAGPQLTLCPECGRVLVPCSS